MPRDFFELLLARQILDELEDEALHQPPKIGIERRFRQSLKFQVQRRREQKARREALVKELAEKTGRPISDFERLMHLEDVIEASVVDVDNILQRTPSEISHNEALGGRYWLPGRPRSVDQLGLGKTQQFAGTVGLLSRGFGRVLAQISDEIIDATGSGRPRAHEGYRGSAARAGTRRRGVRGYHSCSCRQGQIPSQGTASDDRKPN